ncbi:MAG: AAA family ATPase [Clostridium sp.]|nr:AAA family ATPase [Clostridium sp.]
MRINKIRIEGFKDKDRIVKLDFSKTPITILYGDNGCGKTTLLKVFSAIFSRDESVLISENIRKIEIELEDENNVSEYVIERQEYEYSEGEILNLESEGYGYRYNWGEFPKEVRTLLFGVSRGISYNIAVKPEQIERFFHAPIGQKYRRRYGMSNLLGFEEDLAMYLQKIDVGYSRMQGGKRSDELRKKNANCDGLDMGTVEYLLRERYIIAEGQKKTRVQNALFSTLSKAINIGDKKELQDNSKLPDDFHEQLKNKRIKLRNSIKDLQDNDLQKELVSILSNENVDETIQKCKENELLMTLLVNMMTELDKDEEILESISSIKQIFDAHISTNKKFCIDEKGVRIEFEKSGDSHNLSNLSSGERHLLSFLTICILNGKSRDIVMIDEPELSLNGKWKRSILDELQKLLPNTQIIVATHSATVVDGKFNALSKLV